MVSQTMCRTKNQIGAVSLLNRAALEGPFDKLGPFPRTYRDDPTLGIGEVDGRQIDAFRLGGEHDGHRAHRCGSRQIPRDGHRGFVCCE